MLTLKPPYRYLIVDDYAGVEGTNDSNVARQAFFSGDKVVLDCLTAESFEEPDETTTGDIRFEKIPAAFDAPPPAEVAPNFGGTD